MGNAESVLSVMLPLGKAGKGSLMEQKYETLKYVYELEETRYSELIGRGKIFVSIITIYLGFFSTSYGDLADPVRKCDTLLLIAGGAVIAFVSSLLLSVLSLGIFKYEGLCDLKKEIEEKGLESMEEDDFFGNRLADLAVSFDRNSDQNDKRAKLLSWASYLIIVGIIFHMVLLFNVFSGG